MGFGTVRPKIEKKLTGLSTCAFYATKITGRCSFVASATRGWYSKVVHCDIVPTAKLFCVMERFFLCLIENINKHSCTHNETFVKRTIIKKACFHQNRRVLRSELQLLDYSPFMTLLMCSNSQALMTLTDFEHKAYRGTLKSYELFH